MRKITHEEFLKRSIAIWKDRWDYSETLYERMSSPIFLHCKEHGKFIKSVSS